MTTLDKKVTAIIDNVSSDFNHLPTEERKRICRYNSETQILTIWQMLNKDSDLVTKRWKDKQRDWLKACVETHQREYGDY